MLLQLQDALASQRLYVHSLYEACCAQEHPELFGSVALEPLIEINAIRVRIEALLYPGKRWMDSQVRH